MEYVGSVAEPEPEPEVEEPDLEPLRLWTFERSLARKPDMVG